MANEPKTAAAATAGTATVRKMVKRMIIFRPPYTKSDGSSTTICSADVLGCFGGLPVAVKDFALSKPRDGVITVYMPSGVYGSKRVGPLGGELMTDADVAAEATTMEPTEAKAFIARHRAKRASVEMLSQRIIDAWASLPADGKFGVPVEMELPE